MPAEVVSITGQREGAYVLLDLCPPGRPQQTIGVLLADPASDRAWMRLRERLDDIAGPDVCETLADLEVHLRSRLADSGGEAFMAWMEDSLSGVLRATDRKRVMVDAFTRTLDELYSRHVEPLPVAPYQTHLPLFSMRAAAGFIGDEMHPEEEEWVRAPEGMRLDRDLIVVHVVGRSMEPRIPDGSLNVFRLHPVGSRQNKILLIQRQGVFDETAGCTVKKYTSVKSYAGEEWRHERIRLEPLNPEYEAWDVDPEGFSVIAEWVRVIE